MRTKVEDGVRDVRKALEGEDIDTIRRTTDELNQIMSQVGAAAYQQDEPPAGPGEGTQTGSDEGPSDEDVVEGEFTDA